MAQVVHINLYIYILLYLFIYGYIFLLEVKVKIWKMNNVVLITFERYPDHVYGRFLIGTFSLHRNKSVWKWLNFKVLISEGWKLPSGLSERQRVGIFGHFCVPAHSKNINKVTLIRNKIYQNSQISRKFALLK